MANIPASMKNKTKRFLFYTKGTDSTLLLEYLTDLLKKNTSDELVLVLAANNMMRSGAEEKVQNSLSGVCERLIKGDLKPIANRTSVLVHHQGVFQQHDYKMNAVVIDDEIETSHSINISATKQNKDLAKYKASFCGQELNLLAMIPTLMSFIGTCRNKFYIGACGSDIASNEVHKLKTIFETMMDVHFRLSCENDLDLELKKAKLETYSRNGGVYFNKEWIPTIHFPLTTLQKNDVILLLKLRNAIAYDVDKSEDLMGYYGITNNFELSILTKVYHELSLDNNLHQDSIITSLIDFIKTEEFSYKTSKGEIKTIEGEVIKEKLFCAGLQFAARGMGISLPNLK